MTPASSPYAVFQASDWSSLEAEPIALRQCLRVHHKKSYQKRDIQKKKAGSISKKASLKDHVQLAFA